MHNVITTRQITDATHLAEYDAEWAVMLEIDGLEAAVVLEDADGERHVMKIGKDTVYRGAFFAALMDWERFETPDTEGPAALAAWAAYRNDLADRS